MAEVFPPSWLQPSALDMVIDFIRFLPLSARQRKATLYEWCQAAGVELTAEMVERVTGLPAGEM